MQELDYSFLNPGIRRTVKMLRDWGFDTRDSGDGVTRQYECDLGFPYVVIILNNPASLQAEADRLNMLLQQSGIEAGYQSEDGRSVAIQASYCPATFATDIMLMGLTDDMLPVSE